MKHKRQICQQLPLQEPIKKEANLKYVNQDDRKSKYGEIQLKCRVVFLFSLCIFPFFLIQDVLSSFKNNFYTNKMF